MFVAAFGACARHIAVGQKFAGLLVIWLERSLDGKFAFVIETAEKLAGCGVVKLRGCARIYVKRHTEVFERLFDDCVVAVDDLLGGDALFAGTQGNGDTMFVGAAYHDDVASAQTQEAGIDVGRDVDAGQMTDMDRPVGIGEGRRYECSFEFLIHGCY